MSTFYFFGGSLFPPKNLSLPCGCCFIHISLRELIFLNINEGPNSGASELLSRFDIIFSVWTQFSGQSIVFHETTPCLITRVVIIFPPHPYSLRHYHLY